MELLTRMQLLICNSTTWMKINLVNNYDHMDERFHMDAFENTNVVCNMDEVLKHE